MAKSERALRVWAAERDVGAAAEAAGRAALPAHDRQIEDAGYALMLAEHNDTVGSHSLIAAARARLVCLQHSA